jgi:hypothetical protein
MYSAILKKMGTRLPATVPLFRNMAGSIKEKLLNFSIKFKEKS